MQKKILRSFQEKKGMLSFITEHVVSVIFTLSVTGLLYFFRNQVLDIYRNLYYGKFLDKKKVEEYSYKQVLDGEMMPVSKIKIKIDNNKYNLSEAIPDYLVYEQMEKAFRFYQYWAKLKGVRLFNGTVSRLANYKKENNELIIAAQQLDYFDYIKGHLMPDIKLKRYFSLRKYIRQNPEIYHKLPRNIGISFLLVTRDNKIVLQQRSSKTIVNPGTIAPSASGVLQFYDAQLLKNKPEQNVNALGRELFDELGILPSDLSGMFLAGIYEDKAKLGSPGLFFIAMSNKSFEEIKAEYEKVPRDKFETQDIYAETIEGFVNMKNKKVAGTLKVYLQNNNIKSHLLNMKL